MPIPIALHRFLSPHVLQAVLTLAQLLSRVLTGLNTCWSESTSVLSICFLCSLTRLSFEKLAGWRHELWNVNKIARYLIMSLDDTSFNKSYGGSSLLWSITASKKWFTRFWTQGSILQCCEIQFCEFDIRSDARIMSQSILTLSQKLR